ncbi:MAG: insulinase family protein [Clostridia bacterium]|nr:insulinase family protein [Clostridia bacterium]
MAFDLITLDNGLRIIGEFIPHYRSVSVGLWVESGSQYEIGRENGISHFIEHMVFKGTDKRSARDIAEEMDAVGGQLNAFTSKECTCFYAKVVDEHLPLAMDVISDLVRHPKLDETDIEKEKGVVIEEIYMAEDTPEDLAFEMLMLAHFGDQSVARPILGTEEYVNGFTREMVADYMARMYRPERCVLALAGNYKWNEVVEQAKALYGDWKMTGEKRPEIHTAEIAPGMLTRNKDIEQTHICIGFPSSCIGSKDVYPLALMNSVYGGAMSSRLFQTIREEKGMAYTVYSYPNAYTDTGMLAVYAGTSPEHADEVVRLIFEETKKLAEEGLTEKEFKQAREQLLASFILGLESTSSRMNSIGRRLLLLNDTQSDDDVVEKIKRITLEDVNALAKKVLSAPFSCAIVGNKADSVMVERDFENGQA